MKKLKMVIKLTQLPRFTNQIHQNTVSFQLRGFCVFQFKYFLS